MNFRLRLAVWFSLALLAIIGLLITTAHHHLDQELRKEKWDRSHPKFPDWSLHGSFTDAEVHDILGELIQVWAWVGVPSVGLALGVGFLLANRSVKPIRRINLALAATTPSTLALGIPLPEKDPVLSELVSQINALLLRVGSAYDEVSAYSSRVAHELRTPLMVLRMRIEQAAASMPPELSDSLQEELARLSKFVERSLLAARAETGCLDAEIVPIDLSAMLEDLREPYEILAEQAGIDLRWAVAPGLQIASDHDFLRQILHNLLGNMCRYAGARARVRAFRSGGRVVLAVANDIPSPARATAGLGLGLRLVQALAKGLEGHQFRRKILSRVFAVRLTSKPLNKSK